MIDDGHLDTKKTMRTLPNIKHTWAPLGVSVPTFEEWSEASGVLADSRETAVLTYLDHLWKEHHRGPVKMLGSLGGQDLAREVAYAYFAAVVGDDWGPANRFLRGERLCPGLHPEYVAATQCYD